MEVEETAVVECYSGVRFAERPLAFRFSDRRHVVEEVIKSWRSPSVLNFVVRTLGGGSFRLEYHESADEWTILCLAAERPGATERGAP
jgi:hypothetical protein